MKITQCKNYFIITDDQQDIVGFLTKITHEYKSIENHNIIIDLSSFENLSAKQLGHFSKLTATHKKNKKSLVIVTNNINFTEINDNLVVVPTIIEAEDTINLDDIERDLGF